MKKQFQKIFGVNKRRDKGRRKSSPGDLSEASLALPTSNREKTHKAASFIGLPTARDRAAEEITTSVQHPAAMSDRKKPVMNSASDHTERTTNAATSCGSSEKDALLGPSIPHGRVSSFAAEPRTPSEAELESPNLIKSYDEIPVLEQTKLPRGGVSVETQAIGRIQFGIPPETIKDSMKLGLPVPQVYIVPVERFCREMGPALGVNLAEFEFPAYFNFFVNKKRCTLIVDSQDAEDNIRRVFSETLLGPAQFRREENAIAYEPEDFAPDFPKAAIPNFEKELQHFRIMPDGTELIIETLLDFRHFEMRSEGHDKLGVPPPLGGEDEAAVSVDSLPESSERADERAVEEMYGGNNSTDDEDDIEEGLEEDVPVDEKDVERRETKTPWTYSQARFGGDVAVVWPKGATEEQKKRRNIARVEIFKMPGGTEYIIHDVDHRNYIIGKARLSGHVKVSESMSVDGFGGHSILDDLQPQKKSTACMHGDQSKEESESSHQIEEIFPQVGPPTFHPPSFGVTVLGNSHGFDKSGSVSGYVLWINGRGVMIDPPPYSSATLEREGIRPRTIVGIILTHCHADHDAGAFQKVLTGSPVVVITTSTIYKSFIRKYAALSALSPALLRHSHRYKPAIIGQPLRFQGATFHFTYTLHAIPCVGFRVEWRGRSMVFTGDHFNSPHGMAELEAKGVLSKERNADLNNFVLQDTDLLLHEAGAPPIHTPLDVLLALPRDVKKRLFVVHTSALPEGCELKVAPTGTKGTIRLDEIEPTSSFSSRSLGNRPEKNHTSSFSIAEDEYDAHWNGRNEYGTDSPQKAIGKYSGHGQGHARVNIHSSFAQLELPKTAGARKGRSSVFVSPLASGYDSPPLVALRPASSTDAWFILNLLSAVPFLSSLSYTSTMELLETARVDAFKQHDIIVPAARRSQLLCVVWEGTCSEVLSDCSGLPPVSPQLVKNAKSENAKTAVWHAGDWTGPIALQPDRRLSGESLTSKTHDIVSVSSEGVKVITVEYVGLHSILKSGSALYRKYLDRKSHQERAKMDISTSEAHSMTEKLLDDALKDLNVLELLNCNSALRKLNAVQKRHLESLAEGPISYQPGERLWRAGCPVDKAFVLVSGSASFVPRRRNAGSSTGEGTSGMEMQMDVKKAVKELGKVAHSADHDGFSISSNEQDDQKASTVPLERVFQKSTGNDLHNPDFENLRRGLERRANHVNTEGSIASADFSMADSQGDQESYDTDNESILDHTFMDETDAGLRSHRSSVIRRRSSRARKANKVLGRLYNRRAFTGGLVFSRGHFLGDVSKMVAGLLASDLVTETTEAGDMGPSYGFGDQVEGAEGRGYTDSVIPEEEGAEQITHSSTLTAGKDGCVVLVFPKASLIPFLDQYPGLLLSLLGTQVVV